MKTLFLNLVAAFEAFHPAGGVNYPQFAGEEGMAFAAQLRFKHLPGGAGSEGVATGADYLSIVIVFRMYFSFHFACSVYTLTFFLSLVAGSYLTLPSISAKSVWSLPTPTLLPG